MSPQRSPDDPKEDKAAADRDAAGDETQFLGGDTPGSPQRDRRESDSNESLVGQTLGKYQILEVLGSGGMGVVYRAHDPTIERHIALKVLAPSLSIDEAALRRFLAEARAAGKLNHPHVVAIYEIGEDNGIHFIAMELVTGGSAGDHLEQVGSYSLLEATQIVADACKGLAAAHSVGLIHRDVKPANLLGAVDGTVKVADFGLAKAAIGTTQQLTQAGQVVGTPHFMSPEQFESSEVDQRSDIYSLGATYYSLLTGRFPYEDSGSVAQVMYAHVHGAILDPRDINPMIPAACAAIISKAMAKSPDERYQSVAEMLADVDAALATLSGATISLPSQSGIQSQPPKTRRTAPVWPWVGIPAVLAIAVIAGLLFFRPWETEPPGSKPGMAPGSPIKVGILHSMSGTMANSESAVVDATLLAIAEINEEGGLLGRPIKPIVADGRSDWPTFAREAERLITNEEVVTVFGCWTSASRKTVVPIFEKHDHLLVYPVQYEGIEESPNVVYTGAAPNQQIMPAVKWAFETLGKRRFFLVGSDYVFPRTANEIVKDQLKQLGVQLVGEDYLPLGGRNWKPVVEKIAAEKPDVILSTINGDSNVAFFDELRQAGIHPAEIPTISFSVGEEELRHLNVADMMGDYAAWNYFQSISSSENKRFVQAFREKYGPQRVITDPMESAYVGIKLWAKAVRDCKSTDTSEIRRAMRNQRMRAPSGDVRIDPATQHTFKTPRIGKIKVDGQFEIVYEAKTAVMPTPYPKSRTTEQWKAFLHDLFTGWGDQWVAPPN